jgi:hypothetical protein
MSSLVRLCVGHHHFTALNVVLDLDHEKHMNAIALCLMLFVVPSVDVPGDVIF